MRSFGDPGALCHAKRLATEGILEAETETPHNSIAPQRGWVPYKSFRHRHHTKMQYLITPDCSTVPFFISIKYLSNNIPTFFRHVMFYPL